MKCLDCGQEMMNHLVRTRHREIYYDLCEGCGSLWLDRGELDKMAFQVEGSVEASSRASDRAAGRSTRQCPRCARQALDKVRFLEHSDIMLDRCGNCEGFWLDGGELDRINAELSKIMPVSGRGFSDFVTGVHIPYWSKRIKVRSSETDFAVEVPVLKGAERVGDTELTCPNCGAKLGRYRLFGIEFEGCAECRGIFLDCNELRRLKDRRREEPDLRWLDDDVDAIERAAVAISDRRCPKCSGHRLMTTVCGDTKVLVDYCTECSGVWLDASEFQEILQALREKLAHMTTPEAAKKVWEEIKDIWTGPEDAISELLDAKAAISALINIAIFSSPTLHDHASRLAEAGRRMGMM